MGDLRTNQLIGTFGPGAIYDMVNFSVIILSADYWLKGDHDKDLVIIDNAVKNVVQARMRELTDFKIPNIFGLMMPPFDPESADETERATGYVLSHRFPLFHRCGRCGVLCRLKKSSPQTKCNHKFSQNKNIQPCGSLSNDWQRGNLEPVRFIAKCEDGHIHDFKWIEFKRDSCDISCREHDNFGNFESIYYLEETAKGDFFKSMKIHCRLCNKSSTLDKINKTLNKINNKETKEDEVSTSLRNIFKCGGWRPWIDEEQSSESCNRTIEFVPRGQSSVYIPLRENYISIPKKDFLSLDLDIDLYIKLLFKDHQDAINTLDSNSTITDTALKAMEADAKAVIPNLVDFRTEVRETFLRSYPNINESNVHAEVMKFFEFLIEWKISSFGIDSKKIEYEYKLKEFESLKSTESSEEFICTQIDLSPNGFIGSKFATVSKVEKLKIIGVLLGFHRSFDMDSERASKFHPVINQPNYLPASIIYGEGLFFEFNFEKLEQWKKKNNEFIDFRDNLLLERCNNSLQARDPKESLYSLVHSFSHMLMKQLAFESGFSVTELTEKLYVFEDEKKVGLLIHTSSGDSQCSMGGLSDLADEKKLEGIISRALNLNISCSNDPICIDSEGQGTSSLSHGACFGCLMLPETCCEVRPIKNSFLDRNFLIDFNPDINSFFTD